MIGQTRAELHPNNTLNTPDPPNPTPTSPPKKTTPLVHPNVSPPPPVPPILPFPRLPNAALLVKVLSEMITITCYCTPLPPSPPIGGGTREMRGYSGGTRLKYKLNTLLNTSHPIVAPMLTPSRAPMLSPFSPMLPSTRQRHLLFPSSHGVTIYCPHPPPTPTPYPIPIP